MICGVDEAGKGPVLGPMVLCGVVVEKKGLKDLKKLGVKDSKILNKKEREEVVEGIKNIVKDYSLVFISPEEIDRSINSMNSNFNLLELENTVDLLNGLSFEKAIIDCPSVNIEDYKNRLMKKVSGKELVVKHKAEDHEAVAAASIIAKTNRDKIMEDFKSKENVECGSGYCSDPKTKEFIERFWNKEEYRDFIRNSWSTVRRKIKDKEQEGLASFTK